jgi:Ca2+-transporting ATPase
MFNCRSRKRSAFDGLFRNPFIWVATAIVIALQLLAAYFPPLALVLGTVRPLAVDWLTVGLCTVAPIIIVEITKRLLAGRELQVNSAGNRGRIK